VKLSRYWKAVAGSVACNLAVTVALVLFEQPWPVVAVLTAIVASSTGIGWVVVYVSPANDP
jgi:uncharacterized membrane protein YgaE (UPF0421/DUF939 family)